MITKRNYLVSFLKRLAQIVPFEFFYPLEKLSLCLFCRRSFPPAAVFVIALPRSGSTLTYQCISNRFFFNYLTNFSHFFFKLFFFSSLISYFLVNTFGKPSSFRSSNGFVSGLLGQAEGLVFWRYWMNFGLVEQELIDSSVLPNRFNYFLSVLHALRSFTGTPFLSAYLGHILCFPLLSELFPDALFIRLRRSPLLNALSLYSCLEQSDSNWFSLFPVNCLDYQNHSNHMKAASQLYWLLHKLDAIPSNDNIFEMQYEKLCENPELVMSHFKLFCRTRGLNLRDRFSMPSNFSTRTLKDYPVEDVQSMKYCLRSLVLMHGPVPSLKLLDLA